VEKPFTLTAESGRAAAARCQEKGVILAVGHNRRFNAVANRLKSMIEAGEFGTLLHLEANFSAPGALSYTPDRWRASRGESPGGALTGLGVHMIDLLTWLGGSAERVTAISKRRAAPVDIDDTTAALMTFASGASGYLGSHFACPYTSFLNVYGTAANAFAGIDAGSLSVQRPGEPAQAIELTPVDTLKAELEEFAAACRGEATFRVRPEEAIHNVAVMEAIVQSAAQGAAPVEISSA
jgi:predicted dehydrogenase